MGNFASLVVVAAVTAACVVSCGSSRPDDFPDPELPGRAANPDGVPYPTDNIGGAERSRSRPGDRIPNFTFQGYVNGDRSKGLTTITMSDFFDPDQKRHKLLHLQAAATWCAYCSAELDNTVAVKDELEPEGIVFFEVVVSGNALQSGPSLGEFDGWVDRHKSTITTAIDVRARRLSALGIDGTVMPWDVLIDTRTMEILESSGGSPADVAKYARDGLAFVKQNPPSVY